MKKVDLDRAVDAAKNETRDALQTMYDALNQGQQKKIVKDEAVKALFDRYGVEYGVCCVCATAIRLSRLNLAFSAAWRLSA